MYSRDFLYSLDRQKNKVLYAKITALNWQEQPMDTIEGKITGGNISISGTSAVRRTCSITLSAKDIGINNYYWGLNNKIKIDIGVQNLVDSTQPDIIWFKQGIFLITAFNTQISNNNYTISISGKDKMACLNGEVGGNLTASTDFGTDEYTDKDGSIIKNKVPLTNIIRNLLSMYAKEPYQNIIINDLDEEVGVELLSNNGDKTLYLFQDSKGEINNVSFDEEKEVWYAKDNKSITLQDIPSSDFYNSALVSEAKSYPMFKLDENGENTYYILSREPGETVGYRPLDSLIYAGDLISGINETIVSILDKIVKQLNNYEYFYDVDGRFVFQKKKLYIDTPWNQIVNTEQGSYQDFLNPYRTEYSYSFENSELISSISNNPKMENIKNDFAIWGEHKSSGGSKDKANMFLARYALDRKPEKYMSLDGVEYSSKSIDWRELIYQMAVDYRKHNQEEDFLFNISKANPNMPLGQTGYEQYYTDILGFWRDIYNPEIQITEPNRSIEAYWQFDKEKNKLVECALTDILDFKSDIVWTNVYVFDSNGYLKLEEKPEKTEENLQQTYYAIETQNNEKIYTEINVLRFAAEDSTKYYSSSDFNPTTYWHYNVTKAPDQLKFWFDFLDIDGDLGKYSAQAIGSRPFALSDTAVTGIYFKETPNVLYVENTADIKPNLTSGYSVIQIGGLEEILSISSRGKSSKDKLDEVLYDHSYATEALSVTAVPIYYLEPNTKIYIYNKEAMIEGDYVLTSLNIPLTYNSMMTFSASKVPAKLI